MKKYFAIVLILPLLMSSCSFFAQRKLYEATFLEFFDTVITVMAYTDSKDDFDKFSTLIYSEMSYYNKIFDIYNKYDGVNNLKTVNDLASFAPITVDAAVIELLLFAKEQYNVTDGAVNVAIGPVLGIWHKYRTEGIENPELAKLPLKSNLREAYEFCDIDDVIINADRNTVFLQGGAMSIDVGSLAKGFAVQKVAESMKNKGYDSFLINAGGDVKAVGSKMKNEATRSPWNVGVANPDIGNELILTLQLTDMSTVTSGDYWRYYTVDGQRYSHIVDPKTLFPASNFTSVTVICENAALADSLSTALFIMPYDEGAALIEAQTNAYAIWVDKQYNVFYSNGVEEFLK